MTIEYYSDKLKNLRPAKVSGKAKPHKVCMMNAVIDLIEGGVITENRIYYNDQLKTRFSWHFKVLGEEGDKDSPHLPFYHLTSSGFWHLSVSEQNKMAFEAIKTANNSNISKLVDYAQLDQGLFELIQGSEHIETLRNALTANLTSLEVQYTYWAIDNGKSEKTVKNYIGALKSSIPKWLNEAGIILDNLLTIGRQEEIKALARKLQTIEVYVEADKRGNGMYSAAINSYVQFLTGASQATERENTVVRDIENIRKNKNISETTKKALINSRLGQGKFRRDLISYWKGCAVTNFENTAFLIASHIKPWKYADNEERLDPYNGLLLLSNLDKAFDKGFITFDKKGKIQISPKLERIDALGINKEMNISLSEQHEKYLAYHRDVIFKK